VTGCIICVAKLLSISSILHIHCQHVKGLDNVRSLGLISFSELAAKRRSSLAGGCLTRTERRRVYRLRVQDEIACFNHGLDGHWDLREG
jgi:hypothetical protein